MATLTQKPLEDSINAAVAELTELEKRQDAIVSSQRECIRNCATSIKEVHSGNLKAAKDCAKAAGDIIAKIKKVDSQLANVSAQTYQEYVEAMGLIAIAEGRPVPGAKELGVPLVPYLNGIADLVGELRRRLQIALHKGDKKQAEINYKLMEAIYEQLFLIRFSSSLVGGLRHKVDVARGHLEQARSEMLRV